ncbi:MAG: aconitate hydratase [Sedimentibacter saalensis]|jgi:aconitate hydratase|uniref:aconitate hydratase n=1 Tax=Sedimentibacter saalensis TaxID=130788 RepID=UPI002B20A1EF|nr:aconitate hydratase [Sedimentibacter saalensis]MEA5096595.1 aconitate hydratase [Sedimentibacter saalensis]
MATLAEKIIRNHLVTGEMKAGNEIGIRIDQTLTQDSTGTMAYLQFEAMGIDRVRTKKSVAYIDHNMLQSGPENADDHLFIQTVAKKHGIYYSKPGNGICHQVHLERFSVPGDTLLGSDSHTPTCGGMGMIAMGAGGLDVAVAMAGGEYRLVMPEIVNVELKGKLNKFSSAKDIILEVLKNFTVKGGVNKIFEYTGEGVKSLSVPERGTITNMGAELGATTSLFPSDERTLEFLKAQGRENDFAELKADDDAVYSEKITIDLSLLKPNVALPHSPDAVVPVSQVRGTAITQVAIGSCTNSSYTDMMKVANILDGNTVHENVSLVISPGSKQVLAMLAANGALSKIIASGARILEIGCGPCIGMGQAPGNNGVSLRTFNRNFQGRCGTDSAGVYLVSPEVAAFSAIKGFIAGEEDFDENVDLDIDIPEKFMVNDNMIISPADDGRDVKVVRGPNIKTFPKNCKLADHTGCVVPVLIKVKDDVTTDAIMPSNAHLLPFRSNIPYLSEFCFMQIDKDFPKNAKKNGGGIIVAGKNYGQGSSREHAALVPLYLGVRAVFSKSFARIHKSNLVNNGIIPLTFKYEADYDDIDKMDEMEIPNLLKQIEKTTIIVENKTKNKQYEMELKLSGRQIEIIKSGGLLNYMSLKNV